MSELDKLVGLLAEGVDFSVEGIKNSRKLGPVQARLDKDNRQLKVLEYKNAVSPAKFKCLDCGFVWQVSKARYVTQQKRGCKQCNPGGRPKGS